MSASSESIHSINFDDPAIVRRYQEFFQDLLAHSGLSIAAMGKALGIKRGKLDTLRNGGESPSTIRMTTALDIIPAFGITPDWWFRFGPLWPAIELATEDQALPARNLPRAAMFMLMDLHRLSEDGWHTFLDAVELMTQGAIVKSAEVDRVIIQSPDLDYVRRYPTSGEFAEDWARSIRTFFEDLPKEDGSRYKAFEAATGIHETMVRSMTDPKGPAFSLLVWPRFVIGFGQLPLMLSQYNSHFKRFLAACWERQRLVSELLDLERHEPDDIREVLDAILITQGEH